MNSRPLTYEGADPLDEPVLTPNHFLVGQQGGQLAPQVTDDIAFNPGNRWRLIQNLVKVFWKRWREEFLSTLNTRKKWREAKDSIFRSCRETRSHFESHPKTVNIQGYSELQEPIRTRESCYPLIW